MSAIATNNSNSNEFKTPLYFIKNSPRVGTPKITLLDKVAAPSDSLNTPDDTPEIHILSPADKTPSRDGEGEVTPTSRERNDDSNKDFEVLPSTMLCDLASKVLKAAQKFGWIVNGESPRKGVA